VPRESPRSWRSVASSADGTKLAAAVGGGQIFMSTDSGVTWTARARGQQWRSVASSADGMKLVAVGYPGQIYKSTDAGMTGFQAKKPSGTERCCLFGRWDKVGSRSCKWAHLHLGRLRHYLGGSERVLGCGGLLPLQRMEPSWWPLLLQMDRSTLPLRPNFKYPQKAL
jgi:hypothetical protein